jgi:hypothetical protein
MHSGRGVSGVVRAERASLRAMAFWTIESAF